MQSADSFLHAALVHLQTPKDSNELAFLALTSKAELPVRDRLSFALAQALHAEGAMVAREWKDRIDIAVLSDDGEPLALVELKCMYSFDIFNDPGQRRFKSAVKGDEVKLKRIAKKRSMQTANLYFLVLVTHPLNIPSGNHKGVVKYLHQIQRAGLRPSVEVRAQMLAVFGAVPVSAGCIPCGSWFGTQVEIHYALHRVHVDA